MSCDPTYTAGPAQTAGRESFGLFLAISFGGNAVAMAILVGLGVAVFDLPLRGAGVPYLVLLIPGLVLAPYLYWARLTLDRPKACAVRFAIGCLSYALAVSAGLLFGVVWTGILPLTTVMDDIAPVMVLFAALASTLAYVLVFRMLTDVQRPRSERRENSGTRGSADEGHQRE